MKMEDQDNTFDMRFPLGSTHLMVGPSSCGKTFRTCEIIRLKDEIIVDGEDIKNVIVCYAAWQEQYQRLKDEGLVTQWLNRMPTNEEYIDMVKPYSSIGGSIVVIDDFESQVDKELDDIVRVSSRHYNATTFILFQSLFPKNKMGRSISVNIKFIHCFKNPRENSNFQYLARQLCPQGYKWIVEAFHESTKEPYTCFLIELTQECESFLRYRSNYLPFEFPMKTWVEKR